jgi:hypothetical protein
MTTLSPRFIPCQQFSYICDTFAGAVFEKQLRDYDKQRWAHRDVERTSKRKIVGE